MKIDATQIYNDAIYNKIPIGKKNSQSEIRVTQNFIERIYK